MYDVEKEKPSCEFFFPLSFVWLGHLQFGTVTYPRWGRVRGEKGDLSFFHQNIGLSCCGCAFFNLFKLGVFSNWVLRTRKIERHNGTVGESITRYSCLFLNTST